MSNKIISAKVYVGDNPLEMDYDCRVDELERVGIAKVRILWNCFL